MRPAALVCSLLVAWVVSAATHEAGAAGYQAPRRSVSQVAYAIGISRPGLADEKKTLFAKLLVEVAKQHNFDALSGWAIIDHESHWRADAVGPDGEDIGLAQIRYTTHKACREDRDSAACEARREALFDPAVNIRAMAGAITAWRELCERVTGKAPNMTNWLAGYGGYSRPAEGIYCGRKKVKTARGERWQELPVPKAVLDIVAARKDMLRRLQKERVR